MFCMNGDGPRMNSSVSEFLFLGLFLTMEGFSPSVCVPLWACLCCSGCVCGHVIIGGCLRVCTQLSMWGLSLQGAVGGLCVHGVMVMVDEGRRPSLQSRPSPLGLQT